MRGSTILVALHRGGDVELLFAFLLVAGLVVFWLRSRQLTAWMLRGLRFLPNTALRQAGALRALLCQGLSVIQSWKELLGAGFERRRMGAEHHRLLAGISKPAGGRSEVSWLASAVTLFCAALGLAVQIPGVGGGYQVGIILALTELFNQPAEAATGAAILVWLIMSVPCLLRARVAGARRTDPQKAGGAGGRGKGNGGKT